MMSVETQIPFSAEELRILDAACTSRRNEHARILQNAFGLTTAADIMQQIAAAPISVRGDLLNQVRMAIDEQKGRR